MISHEKHQVFQCDKYENISNNCRLLSDHVGLNLWGVPKGNDDLLNPLGSTGTNPNSESPKLSVEFEKGVDQRLMTI